MRLLAAVFLTCLLLSATFAAAPPAKVPAQWLKWIDDLGDDNDDTRVQAAKKLEALGEDVLPILRRAEKHDDADVRLRIPLLVKAIELKLYVEVRRLVGHKSAVMNFALSPDSKR